MPINSVALLAGALSFSAALAWNKAVNDSLTAISGTNNSVTQAIVITLIIIMVVVVINGGISYYTKTYDIPLKNSVIKSGGDKNSKVSLWIR
jgi:hypothetical protein